MKTLQFLFRRSLKPLTSRAAYQRWAAHYPPIAHNPFMALEEKTLRDLLPPLKDQRVLDLACGTGRWGNIAREMGAAQVISLDESEAMLQAGKPSLPAASLMSQIPLKNACVEVVICGLAVGHIVTPRLWSTLSEIKRILVPGGIALISDVHPFRAWNGAQRTFKVDGTTYAVEHYIHTYADYHAATQKIGLTIEAVKEVSPTEGEPPALFVIKLRAG